MNEPRDRAKVETTVPVASVKARDPRNTIEIETLAILPCGCDGTGRIRYIEREPEGTQKPIGEGFYAGPSILYSSVLCQCRWEQPERDGEAKWWTSKTVYDAEWSAVVFDPTASVTVTGEVPVSEDNFILRRDTENFYWPSSVSVTFSDPDMGWLFPDEARELARLLIEAADAAEAYDSVPTATLSPPASPAYTAPLEALRSGALPPVPARRTQRLGLSDSDRSGGRE